MGLLMGTTPGQQRRHGRKEKVARRVGREEAPAAAAEVMANIFGDNTSYTDSSEMEFGIPPRSFTSIKAAAMEAGLSIAHRFT